ncbi:2-aminoadipate transaminase-like [Ptychodera flava]|uniref:2-aminoadipate transaminase-like n=1 Tax=Ptychodera flava TaxID=63121 RepID=UPI003969FE2E
MCVTPQSLEGLCLRIRLVTSVCSLTHDGTGHAHSNLAYADNRREKDRLRIAVSSYTLTQQETDIMESNGEKHEQEYPVHYYEEIGALKNHKLTTFHIGAAGIPELQKAAEIMKIASQKRLTYESTSCANLMQYGFTMGDSDFLKSMAEFLTVEYGDDVDSDDLLVTAGASQGLSTIGSLLFHKGDFVFIESATFFSAINIFRDDLGMKLVNVPMDEDGMDMDALDELLTLYRPRSSHEISDKQPFWAAVYLVPCFQNPTGTVLGAERCKHLIRVARKHGVLIISDDVYGLLSYTVSKNDVNRSREFICPKRLFAYDDKSDPDYRGNVASVNSFSKIFAPGVRLGWYELPKRVHNIVRDSGLCQSSAGFNTFTSGIMATAINLGLVAENLRDLRRLYKKRMQSLIDTLQRELPPEVLFTRPKGGYHLWIVLPEKCSSMELLKICEEKFSLAFQLGSIFSPDEQCKNCLRLSISFVEEAEIVDGARRLSKAIKSFLDSPTEE